MRQTLVEDRVLARIAAEAVGWNASADAAELPAIAFGQAVLALRVMGVALTAEVSQTLRDDIALVLAHPEVLDGARALARSAGRAVPANANAAAPARAAVG